MTAIEPAGVVVSGVKKAETVDELVVRLYETQGAACTASVGFSDTIFGRVESVRETDLLERPIEKGTARVKGNGFTVEMPAYSIVTVRVRLNAAGG